MSEGYSTLPHLILSVAPLAFSISLLQYELPGGYRLGSSLSNSSPGPWALQLSYTHNTIHRSGDAASRQMWDLTVTQSVSLDFGMVRLLPSSPERHNEILGQKAGANSFPVGESDEKNVKGQFARTKIGWCEKRCEHRPREEGLRSKCVESGATSKRGLQAQRVRTGRESRLPGESEEKEERTRNGENRR